MNDMDEIIECLKESIQGEFEAERKYRLYAEKALEEKFPSIANLFQAMSLAESVHIKNHVNALSNITESQIDVNKDFKINEQNLQTQVKSTRINLLNSRVSESFEYKKKYKDFCKLARKSHQDLVEQAFNYARNAERIHASIFSNFIKAINSDKISDFIEFYVCMNCGNVEINRMPPKCPLCGIGTETYKKIPKG